MAEIRKSIVTDEKQRPIAVQIAYSDWLEIERILRGSNGPAARADIERYHGVLSTPEDPLAFQRRIRGEW